MRLRNFGEIGLEVDRMAGLRVREIPQLGVRHWDQSKSFDSLPATLSADESLVWEGDLLKAQDIDLLMGATHFDGQPRLCRLRSGKNGSPRQSGALRLLSSDGDHFELGLFNLRTQSELMRQIAKVRAQSHVILTLASVEMVLFNAERDKKKLLRLSSSA
ncbi:hypothetical protein GW756_01570 [bacterium]|nr:hypothetical protein [bacterium]NCQ55043.1 hypothetical protein [Candidatus Parcubacteria bacterium]NCS67087.1 hypothetical protein [Candidatus Peregrinibacteria bacterium]NCS96033.1 hypothetical protein [bacterium]